MRKADGLFLVCNFAAMFLGVLLPPLPAAFDVIPPLMLMMQVLFCFLVSLHPTAPPLGRSLRGLGKFTVYKLLLLPLAGWGIFSLVMPEYAVSAMLLGGIAAGVISPFITSLVRGNVAFSFGLVVTTSLIMPFTLPGLITLAQFFQGHEANSALWGGFLRIGGYLLLYMTLPFITAVTMLKYKFHWAETLLAHRFALTLFCMSTALCFVYARYSAPLLDNPALILHGLGVACLLAALYTTIAIVLSWNQPLETHLAFVVGCGTANNILSAIIAAQFLGLHEVLVGSLYSIPLFLFIFVYKWLRAWRESKGA